MKAEQLRRKLEPFFVDRLTTYRITEVVDEVTRMARQEVSSEPTLNEAPCSLLYASKDTASVVGPDGNTIRQTMTCFASYEADVVKGDRIEVRKQVDGFSRTYEGYASEPSVYPTHKEFRILEERPA